MTREKIINFTDLEDKYNIEKIKKMLGNKGEILKNSNRSVVKCLDYEEKKIVIKVPIEKNKSRWIRLLTLFRKSEAEKTLESMKTLNNNGIKTNKPLFAIEERKNGMVVYSYMIFEYIEGEVVDKSKAREVIDLIRKIHKLGYLHSDTQKRNFLVNNDKILTIDAKLKRKKFGKISENMEYIGFARDINEAYEYINKKSISFFIAKLFYDLLHVKRKIRKKYKNTLKKK